VRAYAHRLLAASGLEPRTAATGEATTLPPIPNPQSPTPGVETLTARELEVLRLLALGRSNQAMAQELVVAVGTIKRHVANILDKLQADSRLEAVARAHELGLV